MQLVAMGASGTYGTYTTSPYVNIDKCHAFNQRDQMLFWYIGKEDGFATKEDLVEDTLFTAHNILNHVPLDMRPPIDLLVRNS